MKFSLVGLLLISNLSGFAIRRSFLDDLTQSINGPSSSAVIKQEAPKTESAQMADNIEGWASQANDMVKGGYLMLKSQLSKESRAQLQGIVNQVTNHPEFAKFMTESQASFKDLVHDLRRR